MVGVVDVEEALRAQQADAAARADLQRLDLEQRCGVVDPGGRGAGLEPRPLHLQPDDRADGHGSSRPARQSSSGQRPLALEDGEPVAEPSGHGAQLDLRVEALVVAARDQRPQLAAERRRRSPPARRSGWPVVAAWPPSVSAGWPSGMPSVTDTRPFSAALSDSHEPSRSSAGAPAKTCGCRRTSLSTRSPATSSIVHEVSAAIRAWNTICSSRSPSSSRRCVGVAVLQRLVDLVGLFEQVGHQRRMGLLGVPGAAAGGPQPVHDGHDLEQPRTGLVHRQGLDQARVDRRRVVGRGLRELSRCSAARAAPRRGCRGPSCRSAG